MLKREFFLRAMNSGMAKYSEWVIKAFAITRQDENLDIQKARHLDIVVVGKKYAFVDIDPANAGKKFTVIIDDSDASVPLFGPNQVITINKGDVPNIDETLQVTYYQMLYNYLALVIPFGRKIKYKDIDSVEDIIADKMVDNDASDEVRRNGITIDEYLLFTECILSLDNYTQLFTPAATRKSMVPPPWVKEYRASLIEQYKDSLHDPATIALIDKAMVDKYREYLAGDPSLNFLIKGKQIDLSAKKRFLMYGAEPGIDGSIELDPIFSSLAEGWEFDKLPLYINNQRAGSHNRGFNTRLGGEEFKWATRNSINLMVGGEDCGSVVGIPYDFTERSAEQMIGCYAISGKEIIKVTRENLNQFMGKTVSMRSPQTCKMKGNNRCAVCCGDKLAMNKTGLSAAITAATSGVMYIFMSAAHAKGVKVSPLTDDCFI